MSLNTLALSYRQYSKLLNLLITMIVTKKERSIEQTPLSFLFSHLFSHSFSPEELRYLYADQHLQEQYLKGNTLRLYLLYQQETC